eukprot:CAMPEP_0116910116 /NCGR_PEP_ID=MMETSP0467-20121206/14682_1 /TAXON_ID=283647 /ORGANISM="Mesodinium pulex, Strain SPMC105" /LENGTH=175 /DNA_ID=CAMNT_0004585609 /DNA_START=429 /DNA_END=956 /DNA_ORIENTATION=+
MSEVQLGVFVRVGLNRFQRVEQVLLQPFEPAGCTQIQAVVAVQNLVEPKVVALDEKVFPLADVAQVHALPLGRLLDVELVLTDFVVSLEACCVEGVLQISLHRLVFVEICSLELEVDGTVGVESVPQQILVRLVQSYVLRAHRVREQFLVVEHVLADAWHVRQPFEQIAVGLGVG